MRGRADAQKIDHHQLAKMLPARTQETRFRRPAHRESGPAIQHPWPIDTLVDLCCEVLDFLVGKILPGGENSAEKKRCIDGRQFALLPALAGFHVNEVVEKTVFVLEVVGEKAQRAEDALANLRGFSESPAVADAQARQAKSRGGDAGHGAVIISVGQRAVFHLAGFRAGFKPEEIETGALDLIQQLVVGPLIRRSGGLDEWFL